MEVQDPHQFLTVPQELGGYLAHTYLLHPLLAVHLTVRPVRIMLPLLASSVLDETHLSLYDRPRFMNELSLNTSA